MNVTALLTAFVKLINRGLDKLDEFDKQRKLLQREERRASVQAHPDKAFADLFGEPDNKQLRDSTVEQSNSQNV